MPTRLIVDGDQDRDQRARERAGQMLLNELRRARIRVEPAEAPMPAGAKSGWMSNLAELIVGGVLTGTAVAAVASVVVAFVQRGAARSVTLVDGDRSITIEGTSPEDQRVLLERFLRGRDEPAAADGTAEPSRP